MLELSTEDVSKMCERCRKIQVLLHGFWNQSHELARDEARHGKGLEGLLNRYFK